MKNHKNELLIDYETVTKAFYRLHATVLLIPKFHAMKFGLDRMQLPALPFSATKTC